MNFSQAHLSAIVAFSMWGLFPLYWKIFSNVGAWDLFGHRLIFSFITLMIFLGFKGKLGSLKTVWSDKKTRYLLFISALLISSNWLIYIYAVSIGKVLEASMGYFLNPLINIFVGWLILKEKIRSTQWPSIILATFSILLIAFQTDLNSFPWLALLLSVTFALYGLMRKKIQVGALEGLAFETSVVIVPVLLIWPFLNSSPVTVYQVLPAWKIFVLSLSGAITCLPLVLFAFSAKRLELRTLGFIQYLSPSFKFICGLLILHEPLSPEKLQAFFIIWIALAWYTLESFYFMQRSKKKAIPIAE